MFPNASQNLLLLIHVSHRQPGSVQAHGLSGGVQRVSGQPPQPPANEALLMRIPKHPVMIISFAFMEISPLLLVFAVKAINSLCYFALIYFNQHDLFIFMMSQQDHKLL